MRRAAIAAALAAALAACVTHPTNDGVQRFDAAGVAFEVRASGPLRASPAEIRTWLASAAGSALPLAGDAAPGRIRVLLDPRPASEPVVFGETSYRDGPALRLVVGQDVPGSAFPGEWIAIHELVHLAVPRVRDAAWLGEGLATYYQEVLRARSGVFDEGRCWRRLRAGFDRGRAQAGAATLREDTAGMRRTHRYARVYWSGAAIALLWDVALRRDHGTSLDEVLRECARVHRPCTERFPVDRLLATLQASLDTPVLGQIAARWLDSSEFPDVRDALHRLGAEGSAPDDAAPDAAIRRAIAGR